MKFLPFLLAVFVLFSCSNEPILLQLPIPKNYTIQKVTDSIIVDGKATESAWKIAEWTDTFIDIEGDKNPLPYYDTRVKMLWDDEFLYFYAELEEEHVWGDITQRDAVIFHNNDFEIFIKPNEQQPYYTEFEVNALGTLWELFLARPYRRNGPVLDQWDLNDTQIGIDVQGTLNDPSDIDSSWTVEMAIPINPVRGINRGVELEHGSVWRINFSRVQWQHEIEHGIYSRKKDSSGTLLHENNWVWTEQSAIAMHRPEHWGYLYFYDGSDSEIEYRSQEELTQYQLLFHLYRAQLDHFSTEKFYTKNLLPGNHILANGFKFNYTINITALGFEIIVNDSTGNSVAVNQDGYLTKLP